MRRKPKYVNISDEEWEYAGLYSHGSDGKIGIYLSNEALRYARESIWKGGWNSN